MKSQMKETAGSRLTRIVYGKQLKGIMGEIIPIYANMFSKHYVTPRGSNIRHKSDLLFNKEEFLSSVTLYYPSPVHSEKKLSQMLADELMKPSILPGISLVVNAACGKHCKMNYQKLILGHWHSRVCGQWSLNLNQSKSKTTQVAYFSKVPLLSRHDQV